MTSSMSIFSGNRSGSMGSTTVLVDYKRLLSENPEYVATVSIPDLGPYTAISGLMDIDGNFSFGADTQYNDVMPASDWLSEMQKYYNVAQNAGNHPQVAFQSLRLSEQQFTGFNIKPFSVSLKVPVITQLDDPYTIVIKLLSYCIGYRHGDGEAGAGNITLLGKEVSREFILYAPHMYRVVYSDDLGGYRDEPKNAAMVSIGSRFCFRNMLITSVSGEYSNVVYSDGKVTDVQIRFDFKPWRQPNLGTIYQWHNKSVR